MTKASVIVAERHFLSVNQQEPQFIDYFWRLEENVYVLNPNCFELCLNFVLINLFFF